MSFDIGWTSFFVTDSKTGYQTDDLNVYLPNDIFWLDFSNMRNRIIHGDVLKNEGITFYFMLLKLIEPSKLMEDLNSNEIHITR